MSDTIKFTLISSVNPSLLTKVYELKDGKLHKVKGKGGGSLISGHAKIIEISFSLLPAYLDNLKSNQAVVWGVIKGGRPGDIYQVVTIGALPSPRPPNVIARAREFFEFAEHAVMPFDIDPPPDYARINADPIEILRKVCPHIFDAPHIIRQSASSGIFHGKKCLKSGGVRMLVRVGDGVNIEDTGKDIYKRCWLAGQGWIFISDNGSALDRSTIDRAVYWAERFDFCAGAVVSAPLVRRPDKTQIFNVENHPMVAMPYLSAVENIEVDRLQEEMKKLPAVQDRQDKARNKYIAVNHPKASPTERAKIKKKMVAVQDGGTLSLDHVLYYADGSGKFTVRAVWSDLKKYNDVDIKDPIEPKYKAGVKLYTNRGQPIIHSHAHGEKNYYFEKPPACVFAQKMVGGGGWKPGYFTTFENLEKPKKGLVKAYFPLCVDSEFQTFSPADVVNGGSISSIAISVQTKVFSFENPKIWNHPANPIPRYPVMKQQLIAWDVLEDCGLEVEYLESSKVSAQVQIVFVFYAHFAVAEVCKIAQGSVLEFFNAAMRAKKGPRIEMKKGLKCVGVKKNRAVPLSLPGVLMVNGVPCLAKVQFVDTIGLAGNKSYSELGKISGVALPSKEIFTSEEKGRMLEMFVERPEDFEKYSLGDLETDKMLLGFDRVRRECFDPLLETPINVGQTPLTIGASVASAIEKWLKEKVKSAYVNIPKVDREAWHSFVKGKSIAPRILKELTRRTCAKYLKNETATGLNFLCKVDGGRCKNNQPLNVCVDDVILDVDVSGCYSKSMQSLLLPLGVPQEYCRDSRLSDDTDVVTLEKFFKKMRGELVDGCWHVRFSVRDLSFDQDLFATWEPPAKASQDDIDDDDKDAEMQGENVINLNEVHNGILTSDLWEIIENVWSKRERTEFLKKAVVDIAQVFKKSGKKDSLEGALSGLLKKGDWAGARVNGQKVWYGVPMSELVGRLAELRAEAKKVEEKGPLQDMYKLFVNTIYGVMVSSHFKIGNVVFGNNVTARARAMVYLAEKALHGFQTITDGCAFSINKIVCRTGKRSLSSQKLVELSRFDGKTHFQTSGDVAAVSHGLKWGCLGGKKWSLETVNGEPVLCCAGVKLEGWSKIKSVLDSAALRHINEFFGGAGDTGLSVLDKGIFDFESKYIFHRGTFHGSANYLLESEIEGRSVLKMRGYESKKEHWSPVLDTSGSLVLKPSNTPSTELFESLAGDLKRLALPELRIKQQILKPGTYRNQYQTRFEGSPLLVGDNFYRCQIVRIMNLRTFHFRTFQQWEIWKKRDDFLHEKLGYGLEILFLNEDGTIRYKEMLRTVCGWILERPARDYPLEKCIGARHLLRDFEVNPNWEFKKSVEKLMDEFYEFQERIRP